MIIGQVNLALALPLANKRKGGVIMSKLLLKIAKLVMDQIIFANN
ncbi:MAG TPA: hypothetical protein PLQ07_00105 [Bacilli bacterium]|jgi:hypothetical protein|nr:hypothetical protein [Bacilli bacterium]